MERTDSTLRVFRMGFHLLSVFNCDDDYAFSYWASGGAGMALMCSKETCSFMVAK